MTMNKREASESAPRPPDYEQRGIVTDVIVPIVAAEVGGVGGGAAEALVSNHLQNRRSKLVSPRILLPPRVDDT